MRDPGDVVRAAARTKSTTALQKRLAKLSRGDLARDSLERFGALVLAPDKQAAIDCVNALAPEHLHIQTRDPDAFVGRDRQRRGDLPRAVHAGGGRRLRGRPVARAADRRHGPVRQRAERQRLPQADEHPAVHPQRACRRSPTDVIFLANKEGLTGHAASVEIRANDNGPAARPKPKPDKVPRRRRKK